MAGCYRGVSAPADCLRLRRALVVESRGLPSYGGCDATNASGSDATVSSDRLCFELARRSRSGAFDRAWPARCGHAIYKLSVSTRAARVLHRDDDLRDGNETRPLRASHAAHRMHARMRCMYARMQHARMRTDARRYV